MTKLSLYNDNIMTKILAIADAVSPFIYTESFPKNLPAFDVIVSAGDMPGYVLEFVATKSNLRPIYVMGNHADAYIRDASGDGHDYYYREKGQEKRLPGGCLNAHRKIIKHDDLIIVGIEGSARYRAGPHQYYNHEIRLMLEQLTPQLLWNKWRYGRACDILLTHAPPQGPHEGDDFPHRGLAAFNAFHKRWKPKIHIHGHVHLNGANAPRKYISPEGIVVINAFEFTVIDTDKL